MPSFPRALRLAVPAAAAGAALVACGTVTITHDPYGVGAHGGSTSGASTTSPTVSPSPSDASLVAAAPASSDVASGVLAVGDSVMLGAAAELRTRGLRVNAVESRQFHSGVDVVRTTELAGKLPRNVVVHLGTNGTLPVAACRSLVDTAGPERRVFLVTVHAPRPWVPADNANLAACAASYGPSRVVLVDWAGPAAKQRAWFYSDGIHLNGRGRTAYAALVSAAIDRFRL